MLSDDMEGPQGSDRKKTPKSHDSVEQYQLSGPEENEDVVITLFAKPGTDSPFLSLNKLKNGMYEETSYMSFHTFLLFTDIGRAAWNAASLINRDSTIELVRSSILEEDKAWQVLIKNPDLTVLVNSVRFKPMGKYTSTFYVSLDISCKPGPLIAFVRELRETLNRKPWENEGGELDWKHFMKKISWARNEVIEQWVMLSGLTDTSSEEVEEDDSLTCQKCTKNLEKDWMVCPYCGESCGSSR